MNDKSKLVKSHASLSKDCELLSVSLKTKEEELTLLTKSFETLKLTYLDTLAKAYSSPIINVDACTMIRLQRIYIFYCSMMLYCQAWMFYNYL